ncbi:MAG: hypothetical protein HUJ22_01905 [Gracilimonas sp.]|nr:hypothetical protein [Gracilimonas sp.]
MKVDFSEIKDKQASNSTASGESNFAVATKAATVMKAILDLNVAIPRTLVKAAQRHNPEYISAGEWEWNYSTEAGGDNFGVRITAKTNPNNDVTWRFFVTNSATAPPLKDALFFEGRSDFLGTSGKWMYYNPTAEDYEQVSLITWERNENIESVDLEVTSDRNDNMGDIIEFNFDGTVKKAIYRDVSSGETAIISYNTEANTGSILAPGYNNGNRACWDETLKNISCPK